MRLPKWLRRLQPPTLYRLGKHAAREDSRTFKFAKYVTALTPTPPVVNWAQALEINSWPMYGNDTLGDCVEAASGHLIELWDDGSDNNLGMPTLQQIIAAYSGAAGYVPGQPDTDNGTDMLSFLNYWRKTGVGGHKILAYVKLEPGNIQQLRQSIYLFGGAFVGLQLPTAVQGASAWTVGSSLKGNYAPGSWGGHCVPLVGYRVLKNKPQRRTRFDVVSWGGTLDMTDQFYRDYSDEAYAILSQDWIASTGTACNHLDMAQLQTDLTAVGAL